jgi:hypothetical protein
MKDYLKDNLDKLLIVNEAEAKQVVEQVKERREQQLNKFGATEDLSQRSLGEIPPHIYWGMVRKFGKDIWADKKFRKEFFDTYSVFRVAEKY